MKEILFLILNKFDPFNAVITLFCFGLLWVLLNKDISKIKIAINQIISALAHNGIKVIQDYFISESPKKITQRGYELLSKLNMSSYLETHCDLLKETEIKAKADAEMFIKCSDWVKTEAKAKAVEIRLNTNMNQEQSNELLTLFIMEKIKKTN